MMAHMIFGVNTNYGFISKSRFVVDRHNVDIPPLLTYTSVVSRDSVWIVLMPSYINGFDLKCTDVNENPKKRVWF